MNVISPGAQLERLARRVSLGFSLGVQLGVAAFQRQGAAALHPQGAACRQLHVGQHQFGLPAFGAAEHSGLVPAVVGFVVVGHRQRAAVIGGDGVNALGDLLADSVVTRLQNAAKAAARSGQAPVHPLVGVDAGHIHGGGFGIEACFGRFGFRIAAASAQVRQTVKYSLGQVEQHRQQRQTKDDERDQPAAAPLVPGQTARLVQLPGRGMQVGACAFQVDAVLLVLGIAGIDGVLACGAAHAVQHFLAVDVMGVGGFTAQGVVRFFRVRHTAIHAPMVHDFAAA